MYSKEGVLAIAAIALLGLTAISIPAFASKSKTGSKGSKTQLAQEAVRVWHDGCDLSDQYHEHTYVYNVCR